MTEIVQAEAFIQAAPESVFVALTDSEAVSQWFAEDAMIDQSAGRYDFWGRYTPEAPDQAAGQHPISAWEPGRRLAYHWPLYGADTVVDIMLARQAEGTQVTIAHQGLPPGMELRIGMANFWQLTLENLGGWVTRRSVSGRPDFTQHNDNQVQIGIDIAAPAADVFAAIIEPEQMGRWGGMQPTVEARVGGRIDYGGSEDEALIILDLQPNAQLSHIWKFPDEPDTVVTWTLEESDGRTRLTLVHSGFVEGSLTEELGRGWQLGWGGLLARIKHMLEAGAGWHKAMANQRDLATE